MDVSLPGLAIAFIVVLALDAAACIGPIPYIKADLERLGCTSTQIKIIPIAKFTAIAGLLVGLWVPLIGVAACIGMLVYFGFAFWFHARAKDPAAKYVGAVLFTAFVVVTLVLSYLPGV